MIIKSWDIFWVEIPAANGHEQAGVRPAIVVQDTVDRLPTVLIIPLTSKLKAKQFPFTLSIKADHENNLKSNSVALVF